MTASTHVGSFGKEKPLAVVTTMTPWHEPPRIRHQVTRQLTRFYNVVYVDLAGSSDRDELEKIGDDLLVYKLGKAPRVWHKLRANLEYFRRRHNSAVAKRIESMIAGLGYEMAILVNFQFDFPEIMTLKLFGTKIYLCNDDFQAGARWWVRGMNRRAEAAVMSAANACLAVSLPLLERLKKSTLRAELFLPGHEFGTGEKPAARSSLRVRARPIRVCYMGFINARLRMDWLRELARDSQFELILIGPIEGRDRFAELLARENVTHLDTLVGEELQIRLQSSDVFVMPYDTRQTAVRAISAPNKLFQYLACGRPVVCSDLPNLLKFPDGFVYVASDAEQFARAVCKAFEDDSESLTASRLEYASQNTWDARGDLFQQIVSQAKGS